MIRIHVDGTFEVLDRPERVAMIGKNSAHLVGVVRSRDSRPSVGLQQSLGFVEPTSHANRTSF